MSEATKKPRDIKNLKARLGRTITPGQQQQQQQQPQQRPSGSVPPGGAFPPPAARKPAPQGRGQAPQPGGPQSQRPAPGASQRPAPPQGAFPPPAAKGGGAPAPRSSAPGARGASVPPPNAFGGFPGAPQAKGGGGKTPGLPGGVSAPPFAKQQQQQQQQPQAKKRGGDPFAQSAAAPAPAQREVKLVVDDSAIDDAETGRKKRGRTGIVLGLGAALGLALGFGVGSTTSDRELYNMAVRDGKAIYDEVQTASKTVDQANKQIKEILESATPSAGSEVKVDYEAVKALRSLEKPFDAGAFARRRYKAFKTSTVDDLFLYHNNVLDLWSRFGALAARTLPEGRREVLNEAAQATDNLAKSQYGMVPVEAKDRILGGLVFLEMPEMKSEEDKKKQQQEPMVEVSSQLGGRSVQKKLFLGQRGFMESPTDYVVMLDKGRSTNILGEASQPFAEFRSDVQELQSLMKKTQEVQGRLIKSLGEVASLEEQFTF